MNITNLSASYDVDLAQKVGVIAAVLYNKLTYLSQFTDRKDSYCWRTAEEFERELGISRKQQESAVKKLEEAGLIKTKNTYIKNTIGAVAEELGTEGYNTEKNKKRNEGSYIMDSSYSDMEKLLNRSRTLADQSGKEAQ